MEESVAIIGASGQLGRYLHRLYPNAWCPSHDDFDVMGLVHSGGYVNYGMRMALSKYDVVIYCAALHDLRKCEEQSYGAMMMNAIIPMMLRDCCKRLVFISTNYVFDGTKDTPYEQYDRPNPINVYGISKFAGEVMVLLGGYPIPPLIIRTAGLYGVGGASGKSANFVENVLSGKYKRVKDDEISNQTYCGDLARAIKDAIYKGLHGVHHVASSDPMTWYEFAKLIRDDVEPMPSSAFDDGIRRPRNGGLAVQAIHGMMSAREGLSAYLRERELLTSGQ